MTKYKLFGHNWHLGHDLELVRLPFIEWDFLINHYRKWTKTHYWLRGIEKFPNVNLVTHYEPGKYDAALLHIDQQIVQPGIKKGNLYKELNEVITDIPKIVLNHGTPMLDVPGMTPDIIINGGKLVIKGKMETITGVRESVGDNFHLSNSKEACEQWGFGDYIIHGMKPEDWWDLPKEPRVFIAQSEAGMSDVYYGRRLLEAVRTELRISYGIDLIHAPVNYSSEKDGEYPNYFDAYRNMLGRSLLYFNPTGNSPMPRARTEAMFSGCCVISTDNHGINEIIKDGENGFLVGQDPFMIAKLINDLIHYRFDEAVAIGQKGKQTAIEKLHFDRFADDWKKYLQKVIGGK